ncbi:MAG TPA: class I SAM-dependent methyltransferase [Bryobacteraceae bacterium]|nr:class I SAM-dependent methyltransferase [Bryobacteraceae bacterium]
MDQPQVLARMRADWNQRAGEDAYYYVAFGRRGQPDDEFFATASDVVRSLVAELKRVAHRRAALEIGCGPGRLMRPLARYFAEIHGVDVSDEMVQMAAQRLRDTPNAHPHHGSGADLRLFPDAMFDFVYSYAVFQHIPSREVVFEYLREAWRVLQPGGILRCQLNGLPPHAQQYDTWSGVRITPDEIRAFAREQDFQLLAVEQIWTQYMWITCRKMPAGWRDARQSGRAAIRNISNALTGEAVAPASGAMAALSLWIENLPPACDLNHLAVSADGAPCRGIYIGEPAADGVSQVNVALPERIRTGLVPVELRWLEQPLCPAAWVRLMPRGPLVPRIAAVTDGINLVSGERILSRFVKVGMTEVADPALFRATVGGLEAAEVDSFCTDPLLDRYEFNFRLPEAIAAGRHELRIQLGKRVFAPVAIEVV